MQIQLKVIKRLTVNGQSRAFYPGDWVEIGKQEALRMLNAGEAWIPDYMSAGLVPAGSGILYNGSESALQKYSSLNLEFTPGKFDLPYRFTFFWDTQTPVMPANVATALAQLERFQVAAIMDDYSITASQLGHDEEREHTRAIIRDLRVPVYKAGAIFFQRCNITYQLIEQWKAESYPGADPQLALLRALYQVKPILLPLPFHWATPKGNDGYDNR